MTFDLQMVDTLKTPSDNDTCVLMTLLCYVKQIFEYFPPFLAFKPEMTPLMTFDPYPCTPYKAQSNDSS